MPKKIKSVKVETVGKLTSTVKTTTGRINAPVKDLSPLKYATITEANIRYRTIADLLVASDVPSIFTSKTFLENLVAQDFAVTTLNKSFSEVLSNVEFLDRQFKGIEKPLSDVSTSIDRNINFLGKRVFDSVSNSETQVFSIIKRLSDFANPVDLLTVPDGSTYNIDKTIRNTTNVSDSFAYVVNFDRVLEETIFTSDDDIISFTKGLNDSVLSSEDIQTIVLDKVLKDTQALSDNDTFSLIKVLSDDRPILDDDTLLVGKNITDLQSVSDFDTIDFSKVLADSQSLTDDETIDFSKSLSEDRPILDDDTLSVIKVLSDDRPALDQLTQIIFEKSLSDFANPIDLLEVPDGSSYVVDKTVSNFVSNITDEFNRTVDYNRTFEDDISNYLETQVFEVLKTLSDDQAQLDTQAFDVDKSLSDLQSNEDFNSYSFIKALSDTQLLSDDDTIDFTKSLTDSQLLSDNNTIDFTKALNDEQFIVVTTSFITDKVLSDSQLGQEDSDVIEFIKSLADESTQLDTITNKTVTKILEDFANPVDSIGVPDGSTYNIEKTLANFVSDINDEFNRAVDYNRTFDHIAYADTDATTLNIQPNYSDSVLLSDALTEKTVLKGLSDTPLLSDEKVFVIDKLLNDAQSLQDLAALSTSKILSDTYSGFEDFASRTIEKSFSDFVLVDDSGFTLVRTSPELPLGSSQLIEDAGYLFMSDYVDPTYFAENYVGTERYFT